MADRLAKMSDLEAAAGSIGATEAFEAVRPHMLPAAAMLLSFADEDDLPIGSSKFGGAPDLPPAFAWPLDRDGNALPFICQIDLTEAADALSDDPLWPTTGRLVYFCELARYPWSGRFDYADAFRLCHIPGSAPLVRTQRPFTAREPDTDSPHVTGVSRINFSPIITVNQLAEVEERERRTITQGFRSICGMIEASHALPMHRLGGHCTAHQDPPTLLCAKFGTGVDYDNLPVASPERERLLADEPNWRLVLQIDQDETHGVQLFFNRLYVYAHRDSIVDRSFRHVWMDADCD